MEKTSVFVGEKLLEIEAKSGLFELEVGGVFLWQYVRYICLSRILEEITGVETVNRDSSAARYATSPPFRLKEWGEHQQFLAGKKELLVFNNPRRVKEGNYYKSVETDRLLKKMDYSYYLYEEEYDGKHLVPTLTGNVKYISTSGLKKIIKYDEKKYSNQLHGFIQKVIATYETNCQIKISREIKKNIAAYIINSYREIYYNRIWARIVLTLVRPKLVIVVSGYNPLLQVMVSEAKKKNITTIEFQHGRIGDTHLAYNYIYKGELESFADYMFVYGYYEKVIPRYPIDNNCVIAAGYPELEYKANHYKKVHKNDGQKVITFISGPEDGKIVSEYAVKLRKHPQFKNIKMIYKLHPCEYADWKKWYPQLENSGLRIVENNMHDIYYFLAHSDYVVGISSTVLFEATEFDTRIFIIKDRDFRKAEVLYKNNFAYLVDNVDNLIDLIEQDLEEKHIVNVQGYFTKNSMENIQNKLNELLKT